MIIGIIGKAGSGKSTVAKVLIEQHGFVEVGLADPLKRICRDVFNFTYEQLWGPSEMRNALDKRYPRAILSFDQDKRVEYLTPRHALQQLGTDWGRACFENVWIDYALRIARDLLSGGYYYSPQVGVDPDGSLPAKGIVIPDVRFPNEVDAIRAEGGRIWKCTRGEGLEGTVGQHASESFIDELPFNAFIPRDVTLEQLPEVIEAMLHG